MQRLCTKFRSLASISCSHRLLHSSQQFYQRPLHFATASSKWSRNGSLLNTSSSSTIQLPSLPFLPSFRLSPLSLSLEQARHVSSRQRKKSRKPMTPLTSKVKKFKMKAYSSYKDRFRTMNDGTIRRWREGKNHTHEVKEIKT